MTHQRLNLGQLIELVSKRSKKDYVYFDFGSLMPSVIDSYRGYYEDIAIGFNEDIEPPTVRSLLEKLKSTIGKTFIGYYGGEFTTHENSRIWVANGGNTSDTIIYGIAECGYKTILLTRWEEG